MFHEVPCVVETDNRMEVGQEPQVSPYATSVDVSAAALRSEELTWVLRYAFRLRCATEGVKWLTLANRLIWANRPSM